LAAKELAVSSRGCVGQVDAEKLAQRSSVRREEQAFFPNYGFGATASETKDCTRVLRHLTAVVKRFGKIDAQNSKRSTSNLL